jgi:transcriptional regulator with XRE-family HTH domain
MRKSIHEQPYTALRRALKAARKKAGLNQQAVAERLGRPQSYVAKYETGDRRLDVVEFVEVCRAVEADPLGLVQMVAATLLGN